MMDSMLVVEHSEPYPHEDGTMGGEYSDYVYDEDHKFRNLIAAEIDTLTRERDEARAEADRLRPAAEAWEAQEAWSAAFRWPPDRPDDYEATHEAALKAYGAAAARARAAKEAKP
jgi:hypothetical protein